MARFSKRMRFMKAKVDAQKEYPIQEAIELLLSFPRRQFPESIETNIHLTINPKKSDQIVRDVVVLPHGTGRNVRTFVFTQDKAQAEAAEKAGAFRVGFEELVNEIKQGELKLNERDTLIATPSAMRLLMPLGAILGPRGLMPNPKLGTVTDIPERAVQDALQGRVQYRNDKGGVIRCLIGKISFSAEHLQANLQALLVNVLKNKPDSAPKGRNFVKKLTLSSTMGPGLWIDRGSLDLNTSI